jgi:hypothetical protein
MEAKILRLGASQRNVVAERRRQSIPMAELKDEGVVNSPDSSLVTRASFEADVGTRGCWSASVMGGGFRA